MTPGIGCSAKPDASDPCVPIPGLNGSAANQIGISLTPGAGGLTGYLNQHIDGARGSGKLAPSLLVDRAWLRDEIAAMTAYITASPPSRPNEPVLIPGDPERRTRAERIAHGVPIDDETWRELTGAARAINVLIELPR